MQVLIKLVSPFAEYDGLVYSYKVTCVLNNGRELVFLDEKPFDLTKSLNKIVSIELATSFISENNDCFYLFEGEIKYSDLLNEYYFVNDELKVLISSQMVEFSKIELNKKKRYCFEEFILKNINNEKPS